MHLSVTNKAWLPFIKTNLTTSFLCDNKLMQKPTLINFVSFMFLLQLL